MNIKLKDCESYVLPEGRIFIGPSNKESSVGYLELNHNRKLDRHNRPVDEELTQIEGESILTLFYSPSVEEVILKKGDYVKIPANKFHIHENKSSEKSLTFWKFKGDITEIIDTIKKSYPREGQTKK